VLRPALKMPIGGWDVGTSRLFVALGVEAVQLLIGLILAVVSILFAVWLFDMMTTRLDEWAELKRGNTAVAALLLLAVLPLFLPEPIEGPNGIDPLSLQDLELVSQLEDFEQDMTFYYWLEEHDGTSG
jgi:hypothetical protein